MSIMAAQTDRLLDRAQGPGSAHSTAPPPQFHWEAITLTSWHSLHSSWVCFFARASRQVKPEKPRKRLTATSCCPWQRLDAPKGPCDEQLAQEKGYFDMQKIHKICCVLYRTKIHERIRKHKPKNSLLCCICMQGFSLIPPLHHPEELQSQIILLI